jgi:hypothetical protein
MQDEFIHPLERSLCKHCTHRVTREISTEGFLLTDDDGEACEDLESFLHDSCAILGIDLDHIVLECNRFLLTKVNYDGNNNFIRDEDILSKVK